MAKVKITENFYEIDGRIRIERGLAIKRGIIATEDVLKKLHPAYSTPHPAFDDHPVHGQKFKGSAMDQTGLPIVLGQPFNHIDHPIRADSFPGHPGAEGSYSWFVFRLDDDPTVIMHKTNDEVVSFADGTKTMLAKSPPVPDPTHPMHGKRWTEQGQFPALETAEEFAAAL